MSNENPTLTVEEAAAMMRVEKMTIYRRIKSGMIPARKVGKSFLIPAAAIERLIAPPEPTKPEA